MNSSFKIWRIGCCWLEDEFEGDDAALPLGLGRGGGEGSPKGGRNHALQVLVRPEPSTSATVEVRLTVTPR